MSSSKPQLIIQRYFVFVILFNLISSGWTQLFKVPDVEIVALSPKGIRVSIPGISGVRQFTFHGKVNRDDLKIDGQGSYDSNKNKWIFLDTNIRLKPSDEMKYWVFLLYGDKGYRKDKLSFVVNELVDPSTVIDNEDKYTQPINTPLPGGMKVPLCAPSMTIRSGKPACLGKVIFEDNFNKLDETKWIVEHRLTNDEYENPFVSYQTSAVRIEQNKAVITPMLQSNVPGFRDKIKTGTLNLTNGCTSTLNELCFFRAEGANCIPPVISGRLSSKNSFSFKYGRIDIRAQFPQGDWIYPELYLVPTHYAYGTSGYESGVIRIAFARGNIDLRSNAENLNNNVLSGGILLDQVCRNKGIVKNADETEPWGGVFHVYSVIWEPDKLVFLVDDQQYGTIMPPEGGFASYLSSSECSGNDGATRWSTGSSLAPFDEEFHIVLGIGVGGISNFPDNSTNKPWENMSPKAKSLFWKFYQLWFATWESNKSLYIDEVKVTAL